MKKSTYQIISELPQDATEWQKDSAVQAYFHPGENNHYSDQPDTLGLPGQRADESQLVDYTPSPPFAHPSMVKPSPI